MAQKEIIDRDTYRKIKKMDRETLTKFILQYGDELLGDQGKTIDLKELYQRLNGQSICRIVDADIKGFFDHMKHEWIIRFLNYYIKDKKHSLACEEIPESRCLRSGKANQK